jgi:hypothetical protein
VEVVRKTSANRGAEVNKTIHRFALAFFALAFSIPSGGQTVDRTIDLPEGIHTNSIDLGPNGTVGIYNLGGNNYSVIEGRDSYDFVNGKLLWGGQTLATLSCQTRRCTLLNPGIYTAHFSLKNTDPKAFTQAFIDAQPRALPDGTLSPNRSPEVFRRLADTVSVEFYKSDRHGNPKGKARLALYFVEWTRDQNLRAQFLSSAAASAPAPR